jgi:hypothetical protein
MLIVDVSAVKAKQNNLLPECGQPIDMGVTIESEYFLTSMNDEA